MDFQNIMESFWKREKVQIVPGDLDKLDMQQIKAWAWCTGMGSDAYILFVRNDGVVLDYNHYQHGNDFKVFEQIEKALLSKTEEWSLFRCGFRNNLYVRKNDEKLTDFLFPHSSPLVCIECICQKVLENSNTN